MNKLAHTSHGGTSTLKSTANIVAGRIARGSLTKDLLCIASQDMPFWARHARATAFVFTADLCIRLNTLGAFAQQVCRSGLQHLMRWTGKVAARRPRQAAAVHVHRPNQAIVRVAQQLVNIGSMHHGLWAFVACAFALLHTAKIMLRLFAMDPFAHYLRRIVDVQVALATLECVAEGSCLATQVIISLCANCFSTVQALGHQAVHLAGRALPTWTMPSGYTADRPVHLEAFRTLAHDFVWICDMHLIMRAGHCVTSCTSITTELSVLLWSTSVIIAEGFASSFTMHSIIWTAQRCAQTSLDTTCSLIAGMTGSACAEHFACIVNEDVVRLAVACIAVGTLVAASVQVILEVAHGALAVHVGSKALSHVSRNWASIGVAGRLLNAAELVVCELAAFICARHLGGIQPVHIWIWALVGVTVSLPNAARVHICGSALLSCTCQGLV
mmetsp:Transcript_43070/g.99113  ORF Transcript_43070/g.99113 Transcript_43070/m.99113 type:complete len:443 (+) Transcript_43070:3014-4342(+)